MGGNADATLNIHGSQVDLYQFGIADITVEQYNKAVVNENVTAIIQAGSAEELI
jgi:hypothetical protein